MARFAFPWPLTFTVAVPRLTGCVLVLKPLVLGTGCASWRRLPPTPPGFTQTDVAARLLVPPDLIVNPPETVVKPGEPSPASRPGETPPLGVTPDYLWFQSVPGIKAGGNYSQIMPV